MGKPCSVLCLLRQSLLRPYQNQRFFLKIMHPIAINAAIKLYIPFSISLLCFVFVFWQSVQCIEKYIKNPQGTRLSLKHTSQINKFPAITICPRSYSKSYNIKRLERCGLRYKKNFKMTILPIDHSVTYIFNIF